MKKILFSLMTISVLLLSSCANSSGSSGDDSTGTKANGNGVITGGGTGTNYTLSFDANYPFDSNSTYEENTGWSYASEFTENGNTYFYEISNTNTEQEAITGSTIKLEVSPYKYEKHVKLDANTSRSVKTYIFNHYNTKKDDSGSSYNAGENITLASDTVLYCFYAEENSDDSVLDFSNVTSYSLKIGETVTLSKYINDVTEIYIDQNLYDFDSNVAEITYDKNNNIAVTAKSVGSTILTAKSWEDNNNKTWKCCITVTSNDFSGNGIEYKLIGTWKTSGSNYSGTITFNADMTGYINVTLAGSSVHDTNFNWSASESGSGSSKRYSFTISNANDNLNGSHGIEDLRSNRFSLNEYFAFGMPKQTTWNKEQ